MTELPLFDSHLHLDQYEDAALESVLGTASVVAVSTDAASSARTLQLARRFPQVLPALGYHPEQPPPSEGELDALEQLIRSEAARIVAIGEVGLPYYRKRSDPALDRAPYVRLLQRMAHLAASLDKPLALHAIREDTELALDILQSAGVRRAHFHWWKGSSASLDRLLASGYMVSITPDILYEERALRLARAVPHSRLLVETDGPWPYEGPWKGVRTAPFMLRACLGKLAQLRREPLEETAACIFEASKAFWTPGQNS